MLTINIKKELWDFLSGQGAYIELLDCFEQAGIELRSEIDEYFTKFNTSK
jgi:type II restriction enzyme